MKWYTSNSLVSTKTLTKRTDVRAILEVITVVIVLGTVDVHMGDRRGGLSATNGVNISNHYNNYKSRWSVSEVHD